MKSTLNCKACNKISTTFDIFTNVPLSLPEPTKVVINIIVSRQPNEIKDIISNNSAAAMKRAESAKSDEFRVHSQNGDRDPAMIAQFQESFKYLTNDQPIQISLRVDRNIKIGDLQKMISEVKDVNVSLKNETTCLVLYSSIKGTIRGIFNPEFKLTQYNLLTNEIEAMEVLTKKGRETIKQFYRENPSYLQLNPNAHLTCLMKPTEQTLQPSPSITTNASSSQKKKSQKSLRDETQGIQIEKCNLFNSYQIGYERFQEFIENGNFPSEIYAVAYHRRFIKKRYHFFSPYQPQILANPIIFILPLQPTGRRIYEEVWLAASNILKKNSIYHNKQNLWWEQSNWEDLVKSTDASFKPFVLKTVERSGYSCSQCNWMQMCSGCILTPTNDFVEDFLKKCHLAIEWHSSLIEEEYSQGSNEVLQHSSTSIKDVIQDDNINLEDCLRKFHEVEDMGSNDNIYCTQCKSHQEHLKSLEIFRPPPILIVQLKRFKVQGVTRKKLTTLVEFPLFNLDLSTFVTDQTFLNQEGISQNYDLYGIINHYGSLHFGHYISIVKNFADNKWYKYDDSHRVHITEDQIQKENAYILFYIRKDVQDKNLQQVFPNIKELFPGKPVLTSSGEGFIISKQANSDSYLVQTKAESEPILFTSKQINEEKDQNEIHYDEKEMLEIELQKKEKLNEIKRNRKRKCRACSIAPFKAHLRQKFNKEDELDDEENEKGAFCSIY